MKNKPKQIAAIICIVLLVLLYVATLIVSVLDFPGSDRLWIFIWVYGKYTQKQTIADIFPEDEGER